MFIIFLIFNIIRDWQKLVGTNNYPVVIKWVIVTFPCLHLCHGPLFVYQPNVTLSHVSQITKGIFNLFTYED